MDNPVLNTQWLLLIDGVFNEAQAEIVNRANRST